MRVMRNALNRGDEDLRPIRRTEAAENAIGIIESQLMLCGSEPSVAYP